MRPIFDSHLDLAWNGISWKRDITLPLETLNARESALTDLPARGNATTSLPEMRRGGIRTCLATMMARVPHSEQAVVFADTLDFPSPALAWTYAQSQLQYYRILEELGELALIRSSSDLGHYWQKTESLLATDDPSSASYPIGAVVAMEGADAIMTPEQVDRWWSDGLRCASLVHYGISAYAHGTGTDGPLSPGGRELLKAFERIGMILDLTHLSDTSFFEAIDSFSGPVLASHQNCRALVPGQRQFSDQQLRLIIDRGGVIGVALDAWMLQPDWKCAAPGRPGSDPHLLPLSSVADQIDHICQLAGNAHHVALGSDLDGGFGNEQTPHELRSIADLQRIDPLLADRGYASEDIDRVFHGNWLQFFSENLP